MGEVVPIETFIEGYRLAVRRFLDVIATEDEVATFHPLFEALSWSVAIDERLQERWKAARTNPAKWWSDGYVHGDTVKGVRFARNRVHHQWADALVTTPGAQLPRSLPFPPTEWRWRSVLPPGRNDEFKEQYEQHVAAHLARLTLQELSDCFGDAMGARPDL